MSAKLIYDNRYQFDLLQYKHVEAVITLFANAFCYSEPMTQYVGMEIENFIPFAQKVVQKAAKDGMSAVALDSGKVIAFAISEDLTSPLELKEEIDPRFKYIFSLLENLGQVFFENRLFNPGQIAHLFITAVDEEYRGQKLSAQVNFKTMEFAKKRHFTHVYCEFTNTFNEVGTLKYLNLAKLKIGSIKYSDYEFGNIFPFKNLEQTASSYLWEIKANAPLTFIRNDQLITKTLKEIEKEYKAHYAAETLVKYNFN